MSEQESQLFRTPPRRPTRNPGGQLRRGLILKLERAGFTGEEAERILNILFLAKDGPQAVGVTHSDSWLRDATGRVHDGANVRVEIVEPITNLDRWTLHFEQDAEVQR